MKGLHIDKRIGIFMLFSLPIIMVLLVSYIVNTQPLNTKSKADEVSKEQTVTPTPSLPKQITCLIPKQLPDASTVTLYIEPGATFVPTLPLQIYAVQATSIQYLSLVEFYPTDAKTPVTSVKTNLIDNKTSRVWFVALQGGATGHVDIESELGLRMQSAARGCQSLISL